MKSNIRRMSPGDMTSILAIESQCYSDPWDRDTFMTCLQQKNCVGLVIEVENPLRPEFIVVGFMIYERWSHHVRLVNLSVDTAYQGLGLATKLMDKLKSRLKKETPTIKIAVSERCDSAHLFLRHMKFKAEKVERNFFKVDDAYEDAYLFRFDLDKPYIHERAKEGAMCSK